MERDLQKVLPKRIIALVRSQMFHSHSPLVSETQEVLACYPVSLVWKDFTDRLTSVHPCVTGGLLLDCPLEGRNVLCPATVILVITQQWQAPG